MVTLKWTLDAQGQPTGRWQAEESSPAQVFTTRRHKAVHPRLQTRPPARRHPLRPAAAR